jgi:hypothetical protein
MEFEPAITVIKRQQTHALDRAVNGNGGQSCTWRNLNLLPSDYKFLQLAQHRLYRQKNKYK